MIMKVRGLAQWLSAVAGTKCPIGSAIQDSVMDALRAGAGECLWASVSLSSSENDTILYMARYLEG